MTTELLDAQRYRKLRELLEKNVAAEVLVNIKRLYVGQYNSLPTVEMQLHTGIARTRVLQGETLDDLLDSEIEEDINPTK